MEVLYYIQVLYLFRKEIKNFYTQTYFINFYIYLLYPYFSFIFLHLRATLSPKSLGSLFSPKALTEPGLKTESGPSELCSDWLATFSTPIWPLSVSRLSKHGGTVFLHALRALLRAPILSTLFPDLCLNTASSPATLAIFSDSITLSIQHVFTGTHFNLLFHKIINIRCFF